MQATALPQTALRSRKEKQTFHELATSHKRMRTEVAAGNCWREGKSEGLRENAGSRSFHLTLFLIAVVAGTGSLIGLRAVGIRLATTQLVPLCIGLVLLLSISVYYVHRGNRRLTDIAIIAFWATLFTNLPVLTMFIAARINLPLQDAFLAQLDRSLGIEIPQILQFVHSAPLLDHILAGFYELLLPMMVLATILPAASGNMAAARQYVMACVIAALIGIPLFAMIPAAGPWTYYGYQPTASQQRCVAILTSLRANTEFVLKLPFTEGFISFPSFHTILAILAAVALWPFRYIRWVAVIVASSITISTITTGWHYVVDVVAGIVIAFASTFIARAYLRELRRLESMSPAGRISFYSK